MFCSLLGCAALCLIGVVSPVVAQSFGIQRPAADQYDVIALRVEFQPDTTRFTTGDGTFAGALFPDGLQPSIDPLPHDAGYFEAHLAFLEHYVAHVSDGRTRLTTHLLPEVVQVSQQMGAYSPVGFEADSDPERAKLIALVEEAWRLASATSTIDVSMFDPERTAFILFHAGVGRDIELLGTTLDKTPQDLPSLFISSSELDRLGAGAIDFKGLPVDHTLVLPRTETRTGFNFIEDEAFLLELSINGLVAASFFNYLGVPDLFNIETGDPAIGPYGLMDPLGIFAYNGLFPPEPSAWTRYYLGWTDVLSLRDDGPEAVTLRAVGLEEPGVVARAEISAAEYFLVENRSRDPEDDGVILQIWNDGVISEQRFQNGDETFTRFNVEGFAGGVVVGVDNYDWALPGGVDENDNELDGGLLIWHVDERRLAAGLAGGGVNTDPERRAIDLEEADSAQDLGFPSTNPFGPAADQGTPFDFYFLDNPITTITATNQQIRFYENRFGPETIPNSDSNAGGPSFIVLEDFSGPGTEMTFVYRREADAGVTPLFSHTPFEDAPAFSFAEGSFLSAMPGASPEVLVYSGDTVDGGLMATVAEVDGQVTSRVEGDPAPRPVLTPDGRLFYVMPLVTPPEVAIGLWERTETAFRLLTTFSDPDYPVTGLGEHLMALPRGAQQAFYITADVDQPAETIVLEFREDASTTSYTLPDGPVLSLASDGEMPVLVGRTTAQVPDGEQRWNYSLDAGAEVGQAVFGLDTQGRVGFIPVVNEAALLVLRDDFSVERIEVGPYADFFGLDTVRMNAHPILLDLDRDGLLDVLLTYGTRLLAFSQHGALVRGFPIDLAAPSVSQPLVANAADGEDRVVYVAATDGYLYAYNIDDRRAPVAGFPLAVGARLDGTPLLQEQKIVAASTSKHLRAWRVDDLGTVVWGQRYGDAQHRSFVALADAPEPPPSAATELLVDAETYNWPNPIRDGQTYLRCMTSEDATVRITVIDAAGSLIEDIELELRGGAPTEHLWQTDAASGLYYARVTATGTSGRTASKLIKMAIIR